MGPGVVLGFGEGFFEFGGGGEAGGFFDELAAFGNGAAVVAHGGSCERLGWGLWVWVRWRGVDGKFVGRARQRRRAWRAHGPAGEMGCGSGGGGGFGMCDGGVE